MGNSDELDLIEKLHEEEMKRIQAMTNDEGEKKIEELLEKCNFHLKKEDLENLAKKYNSEVSGSSFDNYYS